MHISLYVIYIYIYNLYDQIFNFILNLRIDIFVLRKFGGWGRVLGY